MEVARLRANVAGAPGHEHIDFQLNELRGERRKVVVPVILHRAILDVQVLALDVSKLAQPLAETFDARRETATRGRH